MPKISRRRLARQVVQMLTEQPEHRAHLVQQIAGYLIDTKQTRQAHLLLQDIADELYVRHSQVSAHVDAAFTLSQATKDAIMSLLREATGAKTVDLTITQKPDLLGGVIVRTPRHELDASVRRKLTLIGHGLGGTT